MRLFLGTVAVAAFLGCGSSQPNMMLVSPAAPVISSFTCTGSVARGQAGTLAWVASGATSLSIEPTVGMVTSSPATVSPTQTTTYTLRATNAGGTTTATCTMAVVPGGGLSLLAATPAAVPVDGPVALARYVVPAGVAVDTAGNLYVGDTGTGTLRVASPAGLVATVLADLPAGCPAALATDAAGNVYYPQGATLRKVTPGGAPGLFAGYATPPPGTTYGKDPALLLKAPLGLALDSAGSVYVADPGANLIFKVSSRGVVSVLAGTPGQSGNRDGAGSMALFDLPSGVALDASGNVYVADNGNGAIRMIAPGGTVSTLGSAANLTGGLALGLDGTVYAGVAGAIAGVGPDGTVTTLAGVPGTAGCLDGTGTAARFSAPTALAVDALGDLAVADAQNGVVRRVTPAGLVTTQAGTYQVLPSAVYGLAVDAAGVVYVPGADNTLLKITPAGAVNALAGVSGQAGTADGLGPAALFGLPGGVALDGSGNLFVTDTASSTIRKVTPGGVVTTVYGSAARGSANGAGRNASFNGPTAIVADAAGNLYVADTGNATVRKISPAGQVTTLAGSPGVAGFADGTGGAARFSRPSGLAVDATGTVFVADSGNAAIRAIAASGAVTTVGLTLSGTGASGKGLFPYPLGIAVDGQGNLYVTDAKTPGLWQVSATGLASALPLGSAGAGLQGAALTVSGGKLYAAGAQKVLVLALD